MIFPPCFFRPQPLEIDYDEREGENVPLAGVGGWAANCWSRNSRYILGAVAVVAVCVLIITAVFAAQVGVGQALFSS